MFNFVKSAQPSDSIKLPGEQTSGPPEPVILAMPKTQHYAVTPGESKYKSYG